MIGTDISPAQLDHARQLLAELAIALSETPEGDAPQHNSPCLPSSHNTPLLTVEAACRKLSISKWTVYRLIRERHLLSVKIGARRFIPADEIDRFLAQLRMPVEASL